MSQLPRVQYFLGANSPEGFYSLYPELLSPERAQSIYILKGGPGCGKSTLMKTVAQRMEEAGLPVEVILCSGDPDSLDAVLLPEHGVAIVDGTAPHVVEPKYPGVVERYVNLGECYDRAGLLPERQALMDCMSGYQGCYQRAYRCLSAAGEIFEDVRAILLTQALSEKLAKRAKSIAEHAFPKQPDKGPGQVKQRFLGAVTCKGTLCLYDTALAQCGEIYELYDPCGLAHELLLHLLTEITAAGYDVVACLDPMAPGRLAHLLIPEKGVAFLSTTAALPFPGKPQRRIRMDSVADRELLHRSRPRLRFAQRVSAAILDEGMDSLAEAKALHDQLEALYNPHVDFHRVGEIARNMGDEILAEIG